MLAEEKRNKKKKCLNLLKKLPPILGIPNSIKKEAVTNFGEYVGPGYAIPTPEMVEAVKLMARTEGILLDPVYTGKAAAGLIDLIHKGHFNKEDNILFVHSGGSPALYANTATFSIRMSSQT